MLYGDGVLVVLTNYARPANMPAVIAAWRAQSVPARKIVVVDNSKHPDHPDNCKGAGFPQQEQYPNDVFQGSDDVWRWAENSGCPCRFAPALLLYGHKYVVFADDDFLPGTRAIENLLEFATNAVDNKFSTIGQIGRKLQTVTNGNEYTYDRRNVMRSAGHPIAVDLTCRCYMVLAGNVVSAIAFRNMLLADHPAKAENLVGTHDDFLMCCGAQKVSGFPSYIIPTNADPERELIKTEIPNGPEACYKRPGHYAERDAMARLVSAAGWRSLV